MSFFKFIPSMNTGIIQTFGKYSRSATPGLTFYLPFISTIHLVSNRLCENQCRMQVRTADKVFPTLDITLQYRIHPEDSSKAYFELSDPVNQMISYTENTVRRIASSLTLDQLF
jgi:regulator of protease activity HflC (stomatin/prohibitin superfamily)